MALDIHKTAFGEFSIIHKSKEFSKLTKKMEAQHPATEFIVHHGGPHANELIRNAIKHISNKVETKTTFGPSIGSEGFVSTIHNKNGEQFQRTRSEK